MQKMEGEPVRAWLRERAARRADPDPVVYGFWTLAVYWEQELRGLTWKS
jgi:hypothetical protein